MAQNYKGDYGTKQITQPGGGKNATIKHNVETITNPGRSFKIVTGSPRLGPAKMGGNPARNLNPYK